MQKLILILGASLMVSGCGPSQEEREKVAAVNCSIMSETRNMDAAVRVEKMNEARDKIGGEPFLRGDAAIQEAFEWGLCQELVLNETYDERLQSFKDAERERERIAAEKRAEENRIAAEKQRIADSKPTVREAFHSNGKLKSRTTYQSKADGGKKHGLSEWFYNNGQLWEKANYKDGKKDGLFESYFKNGKLQEKANYKDGNQYGLYESYFENGQLRYKACRQKDRDVVMSLKYEDCHSAIEDHLIKELGDTVRNR